MQNLNYKVLYVRIFLGDNLLICTQIMSKRYLYKYKATKCTMILWIVFFNYNLLGIQRLSLFCIK